MQLLTLQWQTRLLPEWNETMAGPETFKSFNFLPHLKNVFLICLHDTKYVFSLYMQSFSD